MGDKAVSYAWIFLSAVSVVIIFYDWDTSPLFLDHQRKKVNSRARNIIIVISYSEFLNKQLIHETKSQKINILFSLRWMCIICDHIQEDETVSVLIMESCGSVSVVPRQKIRVINNVSLSSGSHEPLRKSDIARRRLCPCEKDRLRL